MKLKKTKQSKNPTKQNQNKQTTTKNTSKTPQKKLWEKNQNSPTETVY